MEHAKPIPADLSLTDSIADQCGQVALGCSEVGGILDQVNRSSNVLRQEHTSLSGAIDELANDQQRVVDASDEARLLSANAIKHLQDGSDLIESSLEEIGTVVELVELLSRHITNFGAALSQVERSSREIAEVANTTDILALNATIEATRVGDGDLQFMQVAEEIKSLAAETREATADITSTIRALTIETGDVSNQINASCLAGEEARKSMVMIEEAMANVAGLVRDVDQENDQISRATETISQHVSRVQHVLRDFDDAAAANEVRLNDSIGQMRELENAGSDMFDSIVRAGLSEVDGEMAAVALDHVSQIEAVTEAALKSGELRREDLFDHDYREIGGSNPVRYTTRLTPWADQIWRPLIDDCLARGRPVKMLGLSDRNGFMPTHATERSAEPTGDLAHDTAYCRNGRKVYGTSEQRAWQSNEPFLMAVHRQESGDGSFYIVRTVYAPLKFGGERWGTAELAYILDDRAWPKE